MKRLLFVFMFLLPLSLLAQTTYYVSNSGSDSNSGMSESSPWKSLTKVNSYFFMAGDKILFKRGDSWEGTITVKTSGTEGKPITYGAYGSGDKPKIYGSEVIIGWTRYSGNIYKATFNKKITQLFLNDERMQLARYDNDGDFFDVTAVSSQLRFTSSEISSKSTDYYKGAKLIVRTNNWRMDTRNVTASSGQTLLFDSNLSYSLSSYAKFYLANKLEFLTEPGQWFFDESTNALYLWTPNGDSPSKYIIRGSVEENGIYINNRDYISVLNLCILQQSGRAIYSTNSSDYIVVDGNYIYDQDSYGLYLRGSNNTVTNNEINAINHVGIAYSGTNSIISDNKILDIALFNNLGVYGMDGYSHALTAHGEGNIIQYNTIDECAYNGIEWTGINSTVQYNYVSNACLVLSDGGGIYTYNSDITDEGAAGSVVRGNIVINMKNTTAAIFMDENTHDVLIEDNIVGHVSYAILLRNNENVEVRNNTIFDTSLGVRSRGDRQGNSFYNNLLCNLEETKNGNYPAMLVQRHPDEEYIKIDYNTYVDHHYSYPFKNTKTGYYASFMGWKNAMNQDLNSTFDNSSLADGVREELLYNNTKQTKLLDLGSLKYNDVYGNIVTGKLSLEPFTSKILIGSNFENIIEVDSTSSESSGTIGYTDVYKDVSKLNNRRAMPVTFSESGSITSISFYHEGGDGDVLLGVYSNEGGNPGDLLGVTPSTGVKSTEGWQTISLQNTVSVNSGETVWLSWVFEDNPGIRYTMGSPGRAQSTGTWSSGMPGSFGTSSLASYKYSIYCTYTPGEEIVTDKVGYTDIYKDVSKLNNRRAMPVTFSESGSITSISFYHEGGDGDVLLGVYSNEGGNPGDLLGVTPSTGVKSTEGWQTISLQNTVSVNSGETVWLSWVFEDNPGIRYTMGSPGRAQSTGTWSSGMPGSFGTSSLASYKYSIYCTYTPGEEIVTDKVGYTDIYKDVSKLNNRRAMPVTFSESGSITSISFYHEGGDGDVLLGVYSNKGGNPGDLLGVTSSTGVKSTEGWQTISLQNTVSVNSGETVWLSWVFEDNPGIRYTIGSPGRAQSTGTWSSGMPGSFGTSSLASYKYSIYCTYTPGEEIVTDKVGYTDIYKDVSKLNNRRAMPVTFSESGSITSISFYHEGGDGDVLLGVYSNKGGNPGDLLGVTSSTGVKSTEGWQTISLQNTVSVNSGETVWLSWVFEDNPGIRYTIGSPGRAQSTGTWSSGMPGSFGTSSLASYKYSVYCTYSTSLSKSASMLIDYSDLSVLSSNSLIFHSTEEVTINEGESYQAWTESGTYQRTLTASSGSDSIVTTILYVVPREGISEGNNIGVASELNSEGILSEGDLSIYPNPANTYVNIECSFIPELKIKMIILDSSGKIVINKYVDFSSIRVNISDFPVGIYFVRMVNEESVITKKLIVSR